MQQVNTKTLKFDCGCSCGVIDEESEIGFPRLVIDIRNIPLDCQATWDLICSGAVKGIFQLEGHLGPIWSVKLKPRSIQELSDVGALVRPGCMRAKSGDPPKSMTERYCDRKAGLEPVSYLVPALEPIMKDTYGVLTYQEQSMKIAQTLAGFDLKEADTLRKAIGKKKPEIMAQMEVKFLEGCKKVGLVTNEQAEEIFGWIKKSELYSFNKSHSVSYAKNGYWSAWCKAHFLIPFYREYLKGAEMKQSTFDEVFELVMDAKRAGVEIMPPDLRDCRSKFYIKDNAIYFGLSNIKGVGEKAVETLLEVIKTTETEDTYPAREWNWWYFLYRVTPKIRSDAARALISAGALDYLGPERNRMLFEFKIFESLTPGEKKWIGANASRFNSLEEALFVCSGMSGEKGGCNGDKKRELMRGAVQQLQKPPHSLSDTAAWKSWTEQKLLGVAVTCNKVDDCDTASEANATCKDFVDGRDGFMTFAVQIVKVKVVVTKNGKNPGQKMAFISILDQTCSVEAVVFPDTYKKHMGDIQEGNTVFLHAEKDKKRGGLVVKKVTSI